MADSSALQTLVNVVAAPAEAFASIRERPRLMLPLLLILAASVTTASLYLARVDVAWLTEQSLRATTFMDLTEDQIEQMASAAADRGRSLIVTQGVLSTIAGTLIIFSLQALYLKIVSALTSDGIRYRQWFSLISWTALPAIVGAIATSVFILTNDVQFVAQTAINPLSFGKLAGLDLSDSSTAIRILGSLGPVNIWTIALLIMGYRALTGKHFALSALVVLAPLAFIAAIVFALA